MTEKIFAVICGILAAACLLISIMQFWEKGFLFNNAFIWASEKEREKMDKKSHYRQSAIVFAFCAALFLCMAFECIFMTGWLLFVEGALLIAVLIYAIVSSVKNQTK